MKKVLISHVNYEQQKSIEKKADLEEVVVMFRGKRRYCMVVRSLRHGVPIRVGRALLHPQNSGRTVINAGNVKVQI